MKYHQGLRGSPATIVALFFTLILTAACAPARAVPADLPVVSQAGPKASSLVVLDWAGYELPQFWPQFAEDHPDVVVDFTYFEQDADALAKMQSGFQTDLLHPCSSWWGLYVEAGLVQPIDTSRLSNWPDVVPEMAELGHFNGEQYFVPWDWGYESIVVRTDKIDELPTGWADLWNPAYAGRLSIPDTAETNQVAAALALGIEDPWNTTAEQDELIKQKLIELKPNVLTYWGGSTELTQMMASGDVWIASNVWPNTFGQLQDEGIPVAYIEPTEGRLGWVCGYGISSQAQDLDLAHAYLDARLAPESSASLGNEYWYGGANSKAFALMDPAVVSMFQLDQPGILAETIFYQTMSAEHRTKITTMWDEVKIAP